MSTKGSRFLAAIDPNWNTDNGGGGRGAQNHYALSSVDAIAASFRMDPHWDDDRSHDALVFMWATRSAVNEGDAAALARMLGLRIASDFVWAKIDEIECERCEGEGEIFSEFRNDRARCPVCSGSGVVGFVPARMMGLGFWSRSEHEKLLVCVRGDVKVPSPEARPRSIIYAPRVLKADVDDETANKTMHSAKPEKAWTQVIEPIARACMPGVRGIEWNARRRRKGWGAVGRGRDGRITGDENDPIVFEKGED
jgi:hypothetical protein